MGKGLIFPIHSFVPDLGPNCSQRLSADDKIRCLQGKTLNLNIVYMFGTSFVDLLFFLSFIYYAFVRHCLFVPCVHLLGKG